MSLRNPFVPVAYDPLVGIVNFVTECECTRADPDVFVIAGQTADLACYEMETEPRRASGSGAGLTYEAAFGAAVGEAVERYALGVVPDEELILATYHEICEMGHKAIAPERWALFQPAQNSQIPFAPFTVDTRIAWARAQHLNQREDYYVPACLVFSPYEPKHLDQGERIIGPAISTGAACGATLEEALLKGICEVIERDAFIIMWRNQLALRRIEIDPDSPAYALAQERFFRPGLEFMLFETTLDWPVPSIFGVLKNCRFDPPSIMVAGACNMDPTKAVIKTLLELSQGLQWMQHVGRQTFPVEPNFGNIKSFNDRMKLYAFTDQREAFQFLWGHSNTVKLSQIPSVEQGNTGANLRFMCDELARRDINVLALDLTPVDVHECGYCVIKVLLPECQPMEGDHAMPFLGGKRWQEIPKRLGIAGSGSINPYPHPYP